MGAHAMIHSKATLRLKLPASFEVMGPRDPCAHRRRNRAEAHEHFSVLAVEEQLGGEIYGRGIAARTASSTQKVSKSVRFGGVEGSAASSRQACTAGVGG